MFAVFRQPDAVLDPPRTQIRIAAAIGLFVGLFLLLFQPFGINLWETERKWLKILGFGVISFVFTALHFILWPILFPSFFAERNWTVGRSIWFTLLNIVGIAVCNFLYLGFLLRLPFSWSSLLVMIGITMAVGVFPAAGTVLIRYIRRLRQYRDSALLLHPHPASAGHSINITHHPLVEAPTGIDDTPIALVSDNEKDTLVLSLAELLFIESSDNYCTIYYWRDNRLHKPLLRSSLSRLETQLAHASRLVRCHRSFIVNLDRVDRVTGNAQGYKLHLLGGQFEVPVARRYNETLVAGLR